MTIDEDASWETRQAVAYTLARIGRAPDSKPDSKEPKKGPNLSALNALSKRLNQENCALVRLEIAQSLLLLGPPAYNPNIPNDYEKVIKPYFEAVEKRLLTETDPATLVWLTMTQMIYDGRMFNDSTIAKLADFINKPDLAGRIAALRALALLGERSKAALPSVIGSLKWKEPELVIEGIITLAAMKGEAKTAIPELEKIKAGQDEYLKAAAAKAIELINAPPKK
jgi:hypothetical protein